MADETTCDMTRGIYRRIFGGFINGKRMARVSIEAEAWFWRILVSVDDYGNMLAEGPAIVSALLGGLTRTITPDRSEKLLAELARERLIVFYEVDGHRHIHLPDFEKTQPAPRNGRRIMRVQTPSWGIRGNPGESGCVQIIPGESGGITCSDTHSDTDTHSHTQVATAAKPTAAPAIKWSAGVWTGITDADKAGWRAAYPAVDVDRQLAAMTEWLLANPAKAHKSNWRRFIAGWLSRSQDRGGDTKSVSVGQQPREDFDGCLPGETTLMAMRRRQREQEARANSPATSSHAGG